MRTRDVTITVRCTEDERRKIRERASSRGLKLSDFVLRSALGKKIVVADGFWEMGKQLKAIGNNLNQLTRLAHEGRIKSVDLKECSKTLFDIYGRLPQGRDSRTEMGRYRLGTKQHIYPHQSAALDRVRHLY